jgi:hypothetical protein
MRQYQTRKRQCRTRSIQCKIRRKIVQYHGIIQFRVNVAVPDQKKTVQGQEQKVQKKEIDSAGPGTTHCSTSSKHCRTGTVHNQNQAHIVWDRKQTGQGQKQALDNAGPEEDTRQCRTMEADTKHCRTRSRH